MCSFYFASIFCLRISLSFRSLFYTDLFLICCWRVLTLSLCYLFSWLIFLVRSCSLLVGCNWGAWTGAFVFSFVIFFIYCYFDSSYFMRRSTMLLCSLRGIIFLNLKTIIKSNKVKFKKSNRKNTFLLVIDFLIPINPSKV